VDRVVVVVALVCAVAMYLTWTASRLDRVGQRVETAWAALDAQLVRRTAVVVELAAHARRHALLPDDQGRALERLALAAQAAAPADREAAESDLSRVVRAAVATARLDDDASQVLLVSLDAITTRVGFARQFYNDAVRDNRTLRRRWLCRLLTRRGGPGRGFFEIDDTDLGVA
jgi:hypothetical protein